MTHCSHILAPTGSRGSLWFLLPVPLLSAFFPLFVPPKVDQQGKGGANFKACTDLRMCTNFQACDNGRVAQFGRTPAHACLEMQTEMEDNSWTEQDQRYNFA